MGRKITIPYHLVASGGASGEIELYTVPSARKLTIRRVVTAFPIGNYGELEIAFYIGVRQVHPEKGVISGDGVVYDDDVDIEIPSGSALKLWYRNNNATETRECFIHVIGELE